MEQSGRTTCQPFERKKFLVKVRATLSIPRYNVTALLHGVAGWALGIAGCTLIIRGCPAKLGDKPRISGFCLKIS